MKDVVQGEGVFEYTSMAPLSVRPIGTTTPKQMKTGGDQSAELGCSTLSLILNASNPSLAAMKTTTKTTTTMMMMRQWQLLWQSQHAGFCHGCGRVGMVRGCHG